MATPRPCRIVREREFTRCLAQATHLWERACPASIPATTREACDVNSVLQQVKAALGVMEARGTRACRGVASATARRLLNRIEHADTASVAQTLHQAPTLFLQCRAHALRPDAVNHRAFQVRIAA